jgi:glutaredoxin
MSALTTGVILYSTPGCYLCDEVRTLLDSWDVSYEVVDSDPRYELRVPVVEVDGRVVA